MYAERVVNSDAFLAINGTIELEEVLIIAKQSELKCEEVTDGVMCDPIDGMCLFDIVTDPCERYNRASEYPDVVDELLALLEKYEEETVPDINQPADPNADPGLYDNVWTFWNSLGSNKMKGF